MIEQKTFYICDPERAVTCSKTGCQKMHLCNTTTEIDEALIVGGEPLADISFMTDTVEMFEEDPVLRILHSIEGELFAVRR